MARTIISPEEGAELKLLYQRHFDATKKAFSVLSFKGMGSEEFLAADRETGRLWKRIREICGESGKVI